MTTKRPGFRARWFSAFGGDLTFPQAVSVQNFVHRMGIDGVLHALDATITRHERDPLSGPFPYFCGVAWKMIKAVDALEVGEE